MNLSQFPESSIYSLESPLWEFFFADHNTLHLESQRHQWSKKIKSSNSRQVGTTNMFKSSVRDEQNMPATRATVLGLGDKDALRSCYKAEEANGTSIVVVGILQSQSRSSMLCKVRSDVVLGNYGSD
jgi:hypothetical protein